MKKTYQGFKDNVTEDNLEAYQIFKKNLFEQSKNYCNDEDFCFKTLLVYVEFFKDNHSSIYKNQAANVDERNQEAVDEFLRSNLFKNRETIENIQLNKNNPIHHIENQYQIKGGTYTVAVMKNENMFRDYVGVITDSKTPLWQKGQVKFELKQVKDGIYDMFMHMRNHSLRYYKNVKMVDGVLNDNWFNVTLKEQNAYSTPTDTELTF